jgi:hypothetical protein
MYEATKLLSSSSNPTQGDIRLSFTGMFTQLNHYKRGSHSQNQIASAIYDKLSQYWNLHLDQSSIISSLLDPRYKCSIFENGNKQESIKILQEVFSLYSPLNTQPTSNTQMSSRDYFLNILNNNNYCNDSDEELNRYFNSPCDSITDPLIWWKLHENNYPVLSLLAKDYLSIQATSVPSERAFSISGLAITKTRNRLDPETARATICMKYWVSENIGEKK